MGKITDLAIAVIVIIVGLWVLTRLGVSLGSIITMARKFIYGPSSPSNSTAGILLLGMSASASRLRDKKSRILELLKRNSFLDSIRKLARNGGRNP